MKAPASLPAAVSAACLLFAAVAGSVAFYGAPWARPQAARAYEIPAQQELPRFGGETWPVYLIDGDGGALLVGRAWRPLPRHVVVQPFPDMREVAFDSATALVMETSVRAMWSLVPEGGRETIAAEIRRLLVASRQGFGDILDSPRFRSHYRPRLERVAERVLRAAWSHPETRAAGQDLTALLQRRETAELFDTTMGLLASNVAAAVLEIASPTWEKLGDMVRLRGLDTSPINRAVIDTLTDEAVRDALVSEAVRLLGEPEAERFARVLVSQVAEAAVRDGELRELARDIVEDPAFAVDLRGLEEDTADGFTEIFYQVVGRSGERRPDPLAVRIIRFVLINRRSNFVLLVPRSHLDDGRLPGLSRLPPLLPVPPS